MYVQTIGLSVIKRRIFPYEKISNYNPFFVCGGGMLKCEKGKQGHEAQE